MSEKPKFSEPVGLRVTVDKVDYRPDAETPSDRPHCFNYYITIHNGTEEAVTIRGRKWVVTNDQGRVTAIEGNGVVGQTPVIEPGSSFSYNSYHLLDTNSASAEGSYLGSNASGKHVLVRIPKFEMRVPPILSSHRKPPTT